MRRRLPPPEGGGACYRLDFPDLPDFPDFSECPRSILGRCRGASIWISVSPRSGPIEMEKGTGMEKSWSSLRSELLARMLKRPLSCSSSFLMGFRPRPVKNHFLCHQRLLRRKDSAGMSNTIPSRLMLTTSVGSKHSIRLRGRRPDTSNRSLDSLPLRSSFTLARETEIWWTKVTWALPESSPPSLSSTATVTV